MKRAQISYFLVSSLILLIVISFVFYLNNIKKERYEDEILNIVKAPFYSLYNFVSECVKLSAEEAILSTGLQGGYYNETSNSIYFPFFTIPLYSKGNNKLTPSINKIQEQISYNLEENIVRCVDDFKAYKEMGFEVSFKQPTAKTTIINNKVLFEMNFPITAISVNDRIQYFDKFSTLIPSRYKLVYTVADNIAELLSQKPNKLCVSCLIDFAYKNELNISVTNFDDESILITIIDEKMKIDNQEFVFNFAHSIGDSVV